MLAMTTSPVEGQNVHLRHGGDQLGERYHTNDAVRRMVTRIQRNFRARRAHAFDCFDAQCVSYTLSTAPGCANNGHSVVVQVHRRYDPLVRYLDTISRIMM